MVFGCQRQGLGAARPSWTSNTLAATACSYWRAWQMPVNSWFTIAEDRSDVRKGDQLKAAVDKQAWDESIKSLVATAFRPRNDE